jgi:hypothetical protein
MAHFPDALDALLTRERAAEALTAAGYPVASKTLATKATRGGGPPYSLFSGRALYRWGDALNWARNLTTPPRRSTSEADARRAEGRRTEDASPRPFHAAAQGAAPARRG